MNAGETQKKMILIVIIAIPVLATATWLYLKYGPPGTTVKSRLGFEISVLFVQVIGCIGVSYYSYATVGQSTDHAWWPVIAFLYAFLLIPIMFILAAVIRKLIFKNKSHPEVGANLS
jgi:hypothetical protein